MSYKVFLLGRGSNIPFVAAYLWPDATRVKTLRRLRPWHLKWWTYTVPYSAKLMWRGMFGNET